MPFAREFDDVYAHIKLAVESAVTNEEIRCYRLDEIEAPGRISDDLIKALEDATLCVADITGSNPNVMWEVGFAMAQNKPTVFIAQDTKAIPFDIRDMRTIPYDRVSLAKTLGDKLSGAIRATLGTHSVPRKNTRMDVPRSEQFTIGVTGSMRVDQAKCAKRMECVLSRYLDPQSLWYCGSYGIVDECAIEFLLEHHQNVQVVGYHEYDVSDRILRTIKDNRLSFVDASKLQLPKGINSPSERDLFFLTRCDLQAVFWDGESLGTKEIIDFLHIHQRDCVTAFI